MTNAVGACRFGTSLGTEAVLVQRQGGPCGVLAPVQALTLKHLLFSKEALPLEDKLSRSPDAYERGPELRNGCRAWIDALLEAIWGCGSDRGEALVCALLDELGCDTAMEGEPNSQVASDKEKERIIESGVSLQKQARTGHLQDRSPLKPSRACFCQSDAE
eukprot:2962615-Pyramimonas_sp.AAC.2